MGKIERVYTNTLYDILDNKFEENDGQFLAAGLEVCKHL